MLGPTINPTLSVGPYRIEQDLARPFKALPSRKTPSLRTMLDTVGRSCGAAERHRKAPPGQRRVYDVKQRRVLDREEAGEPVIARIVDGEPRLKAGGRGRRAREDRGRVPQLPRVRH